MIFFGAGDYKTVTKVLGTVRSTLRDKYDLVDKDEISFAFITDFPMYSMNDE